MWLEYIEVETKYVMAEKELAFINVALNIIIWTIMCDNHSIHGAI